MTRESDQPRDLKGQWQHVLDDETIQAIQKLDEPTLSELAEELDEPRSTVHRRLQRYEARGIVEGWTYGPHETSPRIWGVVDHG